MKLTESYLKTLKAPEKPAPLKDQLTPNLYVKHGVSGSLTFVHRSRKSGAWRVHTLGRFPTCTLAEARVKAMQLNGSSQPVSALTFGELLTAWSERKPNVPGTYIAYGRLKFGARKVASISTSQLVKALQEYAVIAKVGANRCLSQWRLCLDYAVHTGVIEHNPLHRVTKAVIGGQELPRQRVLSEDEIRALWKLDDPRAKLCRFLLASGLRINEAVNGYVDGSVFRIDQTKGKRPHWVHLNKLALENLGPFPTAHSTQVWLRGRKVGWTPHDCRRTASTLLHKIGVEPIVVERVLNHSLQGLLKVYNVADYSEKRIDASERLSNEIERILGR